MNNLNDSKPDCNIYKDKSRIDELYSSSNQYLGNTLKSSIYLNGGAIVLFVGLLGSFLDSNSGIQNNVTLFSTISSITSIMLFMLGSILGAISSFLFYKTQISYFYFITGEDDPIIDSKSNEIYYSRAMISLSSSLTLFALGCISSTVTLVSLFNL